MSVWLAASAICLAAAGFHASQARRKLAPLAMSGVPRRTRWLSGLCWDVVTLLFASMATAFALGAARLASVDLVLFAAGLAVGVALLSARSAMVAGLSPLRHPAVPAMMFVAALGLFGA